SGRFRTQRFDATERGGSSGSLDRSVPDSVGGIRVHEGDWTSIPLAPGQPDTILVFLSTTCLVCQGIWRDLRRRRIPGLPPGSRLIIIVSGDVGAVEAVDLDDAEHRRLTELASPQRDTLIVAD